MRVAAASPCKKGKGSAYSIIAKFHYTDTDTDPNGPARTQRSFAAKKVRVRVRVVEFSYYQA